MADVLTEKRSQILLCIVLMVSTFMVGFDMSAVSSIVPEIASHYELDASEVTWVESIHLLFMAGMILIFGKVCDRGAMKKVLTGGIVAFIGGTLACLIIDSYAVLLVARAVQGIGASTVWSATVTLGVRYLPRNLISWAMVSITVGEALGSIIGGPTIGLFLTLFEWNFVFILDLLTGITSLLLVLRIVPKDDRMERSRFDYKGAFMLAVLMFSGSYGLEVVVYDGFTPLGTLLTITFIASLLMFIQFSRIAPDPIIDLSVFKNWNTNRLTIIYVIELLTLNGLLFVIPIYSSTILHQSTVIRGFLVFVPPTVACIGSLILGKLVPKYRRRPFILLTCSAIVISSTTMLFLDTCPMITVSIILVFTGMMWALGEISLCSSIINSAPDSKRCRVSVANSYIGNLSVAVGTIASSKLFVIGSRSEGIVVSDIPYDAFMDGVFVIAVVCLVLGIITFCLLSRYKDDTDVPRTDDMKCDDN